LIGISRGAVSPQTASSRFDDLRLVSATVNTLQSALLSEIGQRLSATPVAALLGFGGGHAVTSEINSAPSGGNGGNTSSPASPTAVLTPPLALPLVAPHAAYAQISPALSEISLTIYVPPG
jgi:hypothetical protein